MPGITADIVNAFFVDMSTAKTPPADPHLDREQPMSIDRPLPAYLLGLLVAVGEPAAGGRR